MISHLQLAQLCDRSYSESSHVVNEVEVYFKYVNGHQVIAYRGTERDPVDIIRDLRVWPWYDSRVGLGHAGFLRGAAKMCDEYLRKHVLYMRPIVVTGHSLGGALAVVTVAILKHYKYPVTDLVTFGAPKVIASGHRNFKGINVTQYVYENDVVPTYLWWTPYRHVAVKQLGKKSSFFKRNWDDHNLKRCYIPALLPY